MADSKVTALSELTSFDGDETFYVVDDDDGTPVSKKVTIETLMGFRCVKSKPSIESVTSSTTLQDDNDLYFPIAASETWVARFELTLFGATGGDIKVAFTVPSGATLIWSANGMAIGVTGAEGSAKSGGTSVSGTSINFGLTGFTCRLSISLQVTCGATPGNVQLQWAQDTSNGTATSVAAGSHLVADRVPY